MAKDKKPFETEFQRESQKIYKNNKSDYNGNDIDFLRKLNTLYGDAANAKGLNVADPFEANMFHYNKLGFRGNIDLPRVAKTYVFFTRPELNFSFENIQSVPFFKWLFAQDIGKMIMAALTDPEYFINAPAAFNTQKLKDSDLMAFLNEYQRVSREYEEKMANTSPDDGFAKYGLGNQDGQNYDDLLDDENDVAELESLNIDAIDEDSALKILTNNAANLTGIYQDYYSPDGPAQKLAQKLSYGSGRGTNNEFVETMRQYKLFQAKSSILSSDSDAYWNTTPFIPLLSNVVTGLDGAKDFQLDMYTYEEDEHGTTISVATGMDSLWKEGDFSTTIEDIMYSPTALMMMTWIMYIHYVSRGYIMPTREHITERILDYTCSAYVFVVGEDGRRLERFGKFTGCFPTSFPLSQQLLHASQVDPDMLHKFSIGWHFNRYTPMDPQILTDFNFISQTEWLIKLKDPFWENLYTRGSERNVNNDNSTYDSSVATNEYESNILENAMGRPSSIWELVSKPGMAGKLPESLIPDSRQPNNFWGGYPYIYKGRELIWVQPKYTNINLDSETKLTGSDDFKF